LPGRLSAREPGSTDREVAWEYSRIFRFLRQNGMLIGTNDLWIAATAVAFSMPLVSRNVMEFLRVPGLRVLSPAGTPSTKMDLIQYGSPPTGVIALGWRVRPEYESSYTV
jgi:hypothetical protein